jgi:hypothetical protein
LISCATEGGGATTVCCGNESFAAEDSSRAGADTGGATTSTVSDIRARELAISRAAAEGAGATTVEAIEFEARSLSAETFGAGAITVALFIASDRRASRVTSCATSGAGAIALTPSAGRLRFAEPTSGAGATTATFGTTGATSLACMPSAGGGPGIGLNASRFATAESLFGKFTFGASTIVSPAFVPRATLIVCVRWYACCPPARPDFPISAPPRSAVCGSSSPV